MVSDIEEVPSSVKRELLSPFHDDEKKNGDYPPKASREGQKGQEEEEI